MKKQILAAIFAAAVGFGASEANAQAPSGPYVAPGVNVSPIPNSAGTLVTPHVDVKVPLGGGNTAQGTLTVPVVVPNNGGPPVVVPPTVGIQLTFPLGK